MGMGLDPRIGPAFLQAGLGYGGSCFPKDVAALTHMAACAGLHPQLLRTVAQINEDQRSWAIERLTSELGSVRNRAIAVWGLTFKPGTDDLRQAPALDIVRRLASHGAGVRVYDPVAGRAVREAGLPARVCDSAYEAVCGADALLLATDWSEFLAVDWSRIADLMRGTLVFDGRNCLDPAEVTAAGLHYLGVGCPAVKPEVSLGGRQRQAISA
jgi:UDPglucose 6-dehydrogenase